MNALVPWDKSFLDALFEYIKNTIGAATTIGIFILAALFGFLVVRLIVRKFM